MAGATNSARIRPAHLRTYRDGLAAQAGHDLTIEVTRWSRRTRRTTTRAPRALSTPRIDLGALVIREGTGGLKPLSDRDRREIAGHGPQAARHRPLPRGVLRRDRLHPGRRRRRGHQRHADPARPEPAAPARGQQDRARASYRATATVVQSEFGIKPYSGFFGALKLRDAVDIEVDRRPCPPPRAARHDRPGRRTDPAGCSSCGPPRAGPAGRTGRRGRRRLPRHGRALPPGRQAGGVRHRRGQRRRPARGGGVRAPGDRRASARCPPSR